MLYNSTQNAAETVSAAQAISQGISKDGGLFVPQEFPKYDEAAFQALLKEDYRGRAKKVFADFLTDFTPEEIGDCVEKAYTAEKFGSDNPAPIAYTTLNGKALNILELWHGPTCAFKDMALQILPHLLTKSLKKTYDGKDAVILVATSGDTGKAALEGFKDVAHTKIIVFYPVNGVSPMQKHQMNTQEGENVKVCAIKGNFDDAQTGVKKIFTTPAIAEKLEENDMLFSSANSINWGRLLPQIVYYISAYCDLVNDGKIALGDKINVVVPTGNFGNILASYYASLMGLPVNKFICASNSNNVLTDFINTGVYDKNRHFYRKYEVSDEVKAFMKEKFFGGFCDDGATQSTINQLFKETHYLCDTHTAVAVNVYEQYVTKTGDETPAIIASTASPYKFSRSVLEAVAPTAVLPATEFDMVDMLHEISGMPVPAPLAGLKNKTARFSDVTSSDEMSAYVLKALSIE